MSTLYGSTGSSLGGQRLTLSLPKSACAPRVGRASKLGIRCSSSTARPAAVIRDDDKEESRKYRRSVFNFEKWAKFRSTSRYYFAIKTIPESRIVRSLFPAIFWVGGFSALVGGYESAITDGLLPSYLPTFMLPNPTPQGLTSFALALLLVFRTNASYGRFDEARKMWGLLLNRGRDLQRQVLTHRYAADQDMEEFSARWIAAMGYSLMCHLRDDHDIREEVNDLLRPAEVEALAASEHRPLYCIQVLSTMVRSAEANEIEQLQMFQNLTTFEDILGGCERLLSTPVPLSYTRHTARFLLLWLTFLPFGLWTTIGWGMVPCNILVAALLLAIEEIGVQIEEPFGILALEGICAKLRKNVHDLIDDAGSSEQVFGDMKTMNELFAAGANGTQGMK
ncbi:hypothetical protein BSKO_06093 [Bryopsis sp. KO-2023]|nr:hypothetical protein BSKO_06093 [Bryopsis sp. KO-2023]